MCFNVIENVKGHIYQCPTKVLATPLYLTALFGQLKQYNHTIESQYELRVTQNVNRVFALRLHRTIRLSGICVDQTLAVTEFAQTRTLHLQNAHSNIHKSENGLISKWNMSARLNRSIRNDILLNSCIENASILLMRLFVENCNNLICLF